MSGIDTIVVCHGLAVNHSAKPVAHRKHKVCEEKIFVINEEVGKLSSVGFIIETKYPTMLANMVLVRQTGNKWRMCVDFNDLNTVCHKDSYHLSNIDRLIGGSSSYRTLIFMDAYLWYN